MSTTLVLRRGAQLFTILTATTLAAGLSAQTYTTSILHKGLNKPAGIAVHSSGDLYFTELPNPGKFNAGNTVAMRAAKTGQVTVIVKGEPAPMNIVVLADRSFYWTCNTAGVIMRGSGTRHSAIATGLSNPNGIAVTAMGRVFFTQLPTPGKPGSQGGKNDVSELIAGKAKVLVAGNPAPTDIAVDANNNLYWTCQTAGVILRRDAKTTKVTAVLNKLEKPTGIAMDAAGNLYFTEVPTPGKSGSQGGQNAVWKYDPNNKNLTLVKFGDPEPTDVTVSADGKSVYWTCTTAGVIMQAVQTGTTPTVTTNSTTRVGDRVDVEFNAPGFAGKSFLAASAMGPGPIIFGNRSLALAPDGLFFATALGMGAPFFSGFSGKLDSTGKARGRISIFNDAALKGVNIFTGFGVMDPRAPLGVAALSSSLRFQIQ
ncbi:MAG: Vgb family protein [Planctomycetota bacterium]